MTKNELVAEVAESANVSKANAALVIDALMDVTIKHLKTEGSAILPGLGKMETVHKPARPGRNVRTGEAITIAAQTAVKFKAGAELKRSVN